jgi:hypothetical protein
MRLSKLFLEYGGLEHGRIHLDDALQAADKDKTSLIAIQCPISGYSAKAFNNKNMHSQLIQKAVNDGIRDAWYAVRAYWVPLSGRLMVYQMETATGMVVDPPDDIISKLANALNIDKDIMQLDIIE